MCENSSQRNPLITEAAPKKAFPVDLNKAFKAPIRSAEFKENETLVTISMPVDFEVYCRELMVFEHGEVDPIPREPSVNVHKHIQENLKEGDPCFFYDEKAEVFIPATYVEMVSAWKHFVRPSTGEHAGIDFYLHGDLIFTPEEMKLAQDHIKDTLERVRKMQDLKGVSFRNEE